MAGELKQIFAKKAPDGDGKLFGLILGEYPLAIDITEEQVAMVQAAVDAGSVQVDGFSKKAAVKAEPALISDIPTIVPSKKGK